jgi:hypothetical protein
MVGSQQKPAILKQNSCTIFGAAYHFHTDKLDYFIGLETGVAIVKPNSTYDSIAMTAPIVSAVYTNEYSYKVLPVLAPVTGVTFHMSDYFNIFLNMHYVKARYFGYQYGKTLLLDELRISAGLGFSVHLKKKK